MSDLRAILGQMMEGRLTARARAALLSGVEEARSLNHNYIGTEHQLLGLLRDTESVGSKVLANLGISLAGARAEVENIIGRGPQTVEGEIGLTPRAKKVMELAIEEAKQLGHVYLGTEHLLLGLLAEGEGIAAGVLERLGVNIRSARGEITALLKKDNVLTCRVNDRDLAAVDMLVEAGIRTTRSDAAAWLIHAGIVANQTLFERVQTTVDEIKRLREAAQNAARELATALPAEPSTGAIVVRQPAAPRRGGDVAPERPAAG